MSKKWNKLGDAAEPVIERGDQVAKQALDAFLSQFKDSPFVISELKMHKSFTENPVSNMKQKWKPSMLKR